MAQGVTRQTTSNKQQMMTSVENTVICGYPTLTPRILTVQTVYWQPAWGVLWF